MPDGERYILHELTHWWNVKKLILLKVRIEQRPSKAGEHKVKRKMTWLVIVSELQLVGARDPVAILNNGGKMDNNCVLNIFLNDKKVF